MGLPRQPQVQGAANLIVLEQNSKDVFKYLWGEDFVHLWSRKHFEMTLETIFVLGRWDYLEDFLNQPVA